MTNFAALRTEMPNYLKHDNNENKKAKDTKKCIIKQKLIFDDYKYCLESIQLENKTKQLE